MSIPAYPLAWPAGWKRTARHERKSANFGKKRSEGYGRARLSISDAVMRVRSELQRMGIPDYALVITSNLVLRLDGFPRSDQREPDDAGIAVYWQDGGERRCMAIDLYDRVADNLAAIAATIEAMRAIERHGGAEILNRAFTGFTALEGPNSNWRDVLGLGSSATLAFAHEAYKRLRSSTHPDRPGGSAEAFQRVQQAYEQALMEFA